MAPPPCFLLSGFGSGVPSSFGSGERAGGSCLVTAGALGGEAAAWRRSLPSGPRTRPDGNVVIVPSGPFFSAWITRAAAW